jgi:hypothetical protein
VKIGPKLEAKYLEKNVTGHINLKCNQFISMCREMLPAILKRIHLKVMVRTSENHAEIEKKKFA